MSTFTTDNYCITPTTTQAVISVIPVDIQRRKSTILTPNIPPAVTKLSPISDKHVPSMTDQTDNQPTSQNNRDDLSRINPLVEEQYLDISLHQKYPTAHATDVVPSVAVNSQDHRRTSIVYKNFDAFILDTFIRFSGNENVILWLHQTERKFNELRIVRRLRFEAISLLIEGDAKRKYLTHRKEIRSFDDFYEFLLLHFDISNLDTDQSDCNRCAANSQLSNLPPPLAPRSTDTSTSADVHLSDHTKLTRLTSTICSAAIVDVGATNTLGETTATTLVNSTNNLSTADCDRTLIDLHNTTVANLIKNPMTFKGAYIPKSTRVDCITYSLRRDTWERFNFIDQSYASLSTDPAQKIFSSINCTRYNPLGHKASACYGF